MSGDCGLYFYIILSILAASSDLWFYAHNWAIGGSEKLRLLQSVESFETLPPGMLACKLPDQSLAFLREINLAELSWEVKFAEQLLLADKLPERLQEELRGRIPAAYKAASKQYLKHLVNCQLLPFSLGRLSEPSSPVFCRALICTFFPALATKHGLLLSPITNDDDDDPSSTSHWSAADEMPKVAAAEDVCQFLSTALVECDLDRQQLCHERLLEIAIERKVADAEIRHLNSVRKRNDQEFAEMQRVSEETGQPMPRKGKKHVTAAETMGASKLREACIDNKEVFTLGLLEQCELDALVPNNFLSQLLRIALTSSFGEINWGAQCTP